jgi:hypothetical protein
MFILIVAVVFVTMAFKKDVVLLYIVVNQSAAFWGLGLMMVISWFMDFYLELKFLLLL